MIKQPLRAVLFLVVLLLLQVVVFDHVVLGGYVIPYVYVLGVLLLPFCFGRGKAMLGAFVVGLVMDLFQQSGGLHAMACVLTVYLCGPLTRVFFRLSEKGVGGVRSLYGQKWPHGGAFPAAGAAADPVSGPVLGRSGALFGVAFCFGACFPGSRGDLCGIGGDLVPQ